MEDFLPNQRNRRPRKPYNIKERQRISELFGKKSNMIHVYSPHRELLEHIYKSRIKAGLGQKEIAKRMGINQSTYSRIETGSRNIDLYVLIKIANALNKRVRVRFYGRMFMRVTKKEYYKDINGY